MTSWNLFASCLPPSRNVTPGDRRRTSHPPADRRWVCCSFQSQRLLSLSAALKERANIVDTAIKLMGVQVWVIDRARVWADHVRFAAMVNMAKQKVVILVANAGTKRGTRLLTSRGF